MMLKIASLLSVPFFVVVFSIAGEIIFKPIQSLWPRTLGYTLFGIGATISLYFLLTIIIQKFQMQKPPIGSYYGLLMGIFFGLATTSFSAALYYLWYRPEFNPGFFWNNFGSRLIGNISPALLEETGFRGGLVHLLTSFFGKSWGMIGGSVPFGIAHLAGNLLGKTIGVWLVLGTTFAGLFLTLVYLRFGLLGAIATHWIWNSFYGSWVKSFGLSKGSVNLEGSFTTIIVLIMFSSFLYFLPILVPTSLQK